MIRAVLFDFDGLLADSEPLQKAAWREYLAQQGRTLEQSLMERMFGLRLLESAALVRQELGLTIPVEQIMNERDALFLSSLHGHLHAMPGAASVVSKMRMLGLRVALATSGHQRYVEIALHELGLQNAFDAVVTGDTVTRGKPAPDIFLRAAELLNVDPSTCIVLEDAPHGVAAARSAGMTAVAVPNELTHDLDFGQAHVVCSSLADAGHWIAEQLQQDDQL
jgi:HAD superfamily hydrolase (TIGR01509 family)